MIVPVRNRATRGTFGFSGIVGAYVATFYADVAVFDADVAVFDGGRIPIPTPAPHPPFFSPIFLIQEESFNYPPQKIFLRQA
jgi:hypothetical protein